MLGSGKVAGSLSTGSGSSYFIPRWYTESQANYVTTFMAANSYVDLEAARRFGIADPVSFVGKRFPEEKVVFLKTTALAESLFQQVRRGRAGDAVFLTISSSPPFLT